MSSDRYLCLGRGHYLTRIGCPGWWETLLETGIGIMDGGGHY